MLRRIGAVLIVSAVAACAQTAGPAAWIAGPCLNRGTSCLMANRNGICPTGAQGAIVGLPAAIGLHRSSGIVAQVIGDVARGHAEGETSGRQVGVSSLAPGAGIDPLFVVAFHAELHVAEFSADRREFGFPRQAICFERDRAFGRALTFGTKVFTSDRFAARRVGYAFDEAGGANT